MRITRFELHLTGAGTPATPLQLGMDEAYTLTVDVSTVGAAADGTAAAVATASTQWGALRALETFSQLVVHGTCTFAATVPLTITDRRV